MVSLRTAGQIRANPRIPPAELPWFVSVGSAPSTLNSIVQCSNGLRPRALVIQPLRSFASFFWWSGRVLAKCTPLSNLGILLLMTAISLRPPSILMLPRVIWVLCKGHVSWSTQWKSAISILLRNCSNNNAYISRYPRGMRKAKSNLHKLDTRETQIQSRTCSAFVPS